MWCQQDGRIRRLGCSFLPQTHQFNNKTWTKSFTEKLRKELRGSCTHSDCKTSQKEHQGHPLTTIPMTSTEPCDHKESPNSQLLLGEGKSWTTQQTFHLFQGMSKRLASVLLAQSTDRTCHAPNSWGPVRIKMKVWTTTQAVTRAPPLVQYKASRRKTQIPPSHWEGKEFDHVTPKAQATKA